MDNLKTMDTQPPIQSFGGDQEDRPSLPMRPQPPGQNFGEAQQERPSQPISTQPPVQVQNFGGVDEDRPTLPMRPQPPVQNLGEAQQNRPPKPMRSDTALSKFSTMSMPPEGSILTGKQEHYLKRELISQQTKYEIAELSSPTALRRFGAPFHSDAGEVAPEDSELPLLRYIFVNHVRNFPFLDKAKEKEFWQDKLQVFLESFASKDISSSEDRLEETKRRKLALKAEKLVELMMVSGIPTASGYEERIRFAEMEIVDRGANEIGLTMNAPSGHYINGWDVNVAGVRTTSVKKRLRYHTHAEYLIRVKHGGDRDFYVGRRYADFVQLHKRIRFELPGKVLVPLPRKNDKDGLLQSSADDDDASSISSNSTQGPPAPEPAEKESSGGLRSYIFGGGHKKNASQSSLGGKSRSPRASGENLAYKAPRKLYREEQRVSLRAFLRSFLANERIAQSSAMAEFLTHDPIEVNEEEMEDIAKREEMDKKRIEEQKQFYEVARKRAAELDIHMEKFRREIVESNGLSHLFQEIRVKNTISELKPEYQKFAEWLRIEVAATIYHLFLAEDNSPELFAQAKRIHSLVPYGVLKNVIRIANPAAVMSGVLDLFLAQPWGSRSLLQRIFGMAINDGVNSVQKTIDTLAATRIKDDVLCNKIKAYVQADEGVKEAIRQEAASDNVDVVVTILRSELIQPELSSQQVEKVFNAYVAWTNAVENVRSTRLSRETSRSTVGAGTNANSQVEKEMRSGAELFAHLKQYLKLCLRQRDKLMMLQIIEEPTTLQLFRDLFTIFYEPLVRVYKSANVYNSITDFAMFADDAIKTIEACQRQEVSADPNMTVQAFIDLCARHEDNFYKFVHEVHKHDNGLFDQLMGWLEGILDFLRHGPGSGGKLDINALFQGGMDSNLIDRNKAIQEINSLIKWQMARKKWHADKTRQKMASAGDEADPMMGGIAGFKSSDFGLNAMDLQDLELDADGSDSDDSEDMDDADVADPIEAERKNRARAAEKLRRKAGEPQKPPIVELYKLSDGFNSMLRNVLAQ